MGQRVQPPARLGQLSSPLACLPGWPGHLLRRPARAGLVSLKQAAGLSDSLGLDGMDMNGTGGGAGGGHDVQTSGDQAGRGAGRHLHR